MGYFTIESQPMQKLKVASLTALFFIAAAPALQADRIAPPPIWSRAARADVIIIGRVVAVLDRDVQVAAPAAPEFKIAYRLAVVKVSEDLFGAGGKKDLRVAYPVAPRRYGPVQLQPGQEALLFLNKHFKEAFYEAPSDYEVIFNQGNNAGFANQVAQARQTAKVLVNPKESLKSKHPEERLTAAAVLLMHYRTARGPKPASAPIDPGESKLILAALESADWSRPATFERPNALGLFAQLGLTDKDGWTPPKVVRAPQDYHNAARAWLREHLDTYRIRRFVAPAPEK
jgi:hypothetical protein